ncbi:MAG: hypothetical protein Q7T41_00235, partial [Candidatus Saccharibacteria bacterium]|nr:hypothetical protein [Candidatus Saccharibacteria bacterium]
MSKKDRSPSAENMINSVVVEANVTAIILVNDKLINFNNLKRITESVKTITQTRIKGIKLIIKLVLDGFVLTIKITRLDIEVMQ